MLLGIFYASTPSIGCNHLCLDSLVSMSFVTAMKDFEPQDGIQMLNVPKDRFVLTVSSQQLQINVTVHKESKGCAVTPYEWLLVARRRGQKLFSTAISKGLCPGTGHCFETKCSFVVCSQGIQALECLTILASGAARIAVEVGRAHLIFSAWLICGADFGLLE
jgi:hypothetical protein